MNPASVNRRLLLLNLRPNRPPRGRYLKLPFKSIHIKNRCTFCKNRLMMRGCLFYYIMCWKRHSKASCICSVNSVFVNFCKNVCYALPTKWCEVNLSSSSCPQIVIDKGNTFMRIFICMVAYGCTSMTDA